VKGDKAINRAAQSGATAILFQGRWWALDRGHVYGTRLDRKTGVRRIVILV